MEKKLNGYDVRDMLQHILKYMSNKQPSYFDEKILIYTKPFSICLAIVDEYENDIDYPILLEDGRTTYKKIKAKKVFEYCDVITNKIVRYNPGLWVDYVIRLNKTSHDIESEFVEKQKQKLAIEELEKYGKIDDSYLFKE